MALMEVHYYSYALQRKTTLQVVLPMDKFSADGKLPAPQKYKTLYLLHGFHGNSIDWVTGTRIQRWATERNLAVVMPAGDNAFYVDRPESGNCYGEFVGRELVEMTRRMFPLSDKREDTFIGGLSMGGFGALRNGLKYSETFGAIICLSGALDVLCAPKTPSMRAFGEALFGPLDAAVESDKNPRVLMGRLKDADPAQRPRLYICCGTEDYLLEQSRTARKLLEDAGFDVTYEEGPGAHEWDFWDTYIKKALDWLPL